MRIFSFLFIFILCLSCDSSRKTSDSQIVSVTGETMGTYYSVKIALNSNVSSIKTIQSSELKKDIEIQLAKINQIFSTYLKNSEISQLNTLDNSKELKLSKQMLELLIVAKQIHSQSEGAFDPTIAPVVNRWGFGPLKNQNKPTPEEIATLMRSVGMDKFIINKNTIRKKTTATQLDFSAIAKGHAVDLLTNYLKNQKGFQNVLVEIGGEVRAIGSKQNQKWAIGIEKPTESLGGGIQKIIPLKNQSVATSGSYRNYIKYGDQIFSHTIDPQSGFPVSHKLISVTVIAPKCAIADAWATALMVMGPEKGLKFADKEGLLAYFLIKTDEGIKHRVSSAFTKYLDTVQD